MKHLATLSALALLVPASEALPQRTARAQQVLEEATVTVPSPFQRLSDTGPRGFVTLETRAAAYELMDELHREAALVRLADVPLPGGVAVDLLLRPVDLLEPGFTATVIGAGGKRSQLAPSVRLFSGSIPGRASRVFLGLSESMVHGYVSLEGETYVVSSGPSGSRLPVAIAHGDALAEGGGGIAESFCATTAETVDLGPGPDPAPDANKAGKFEVDRTRLFLELDHQYRALFNSDQEAIDYAVLLTTATSEIYRRDLAVTLTIPSGNLQVYTETPPWGNLSTFGDISQFSSWWNSPQNPNRNAQRTMVHALTTPVFGGVAASIGGICNATTGYAISSVYGSFPYPIQHTSSSNWDLLVFAHENGHVYGSRHTFEYLPPIRCNDGSGPDNGTIMSYCHQTYGVGGVGMRFHLTVQDTIRVNVNTKPCKTTIKFVRGDYDVSGAVDAADLMELDAYLAQGFLSRGANFAFDFDSNGVVDGFDRQILVLLIQGALPPAGTAWRNGTGANCGSCYAPITEPLLGKTWSVQVGGYIASNVLTVIIGATAPLSPGVATPYGELLIAMNGFGGQTLFQRTALANFGPAEYHIPLPQDLSLLGVTVYTQGAIFWPTRDPLTNALDITMGIW